jgi:hypothetical protein
VGGGVERARSTAQLQRRRRQCGDDGVVSTEASARDVSRRHEADHAASTDADTTTTTTASGR